MYNSWVVLPYDGPFYQYFGEMSSKYQHIWEFNNSLSEEMITSSCRNYWILWTLQFNIYIFTIIQDAISFHVTVALSPSLVFQTPSIYLWVKLWFYEKFFWSWDKWNIGGIHCPNMPWIIFQVYFKWQPVVFSMWWRDCKEISPISWSPWIFRRGLSP